VGKVVSEAFALILLSCLEYYCQQENTWFLILCCNLSYKKFFGEKKLNNLGFQQGLNHCRAILTYEVPVKRTVQVVIYI